MITMFMIGVHDSRDEGPIKSDGMPVGLHRGNELMLRAPSGTQGISRSAQGHPSKGPGTMPARDH